MCTSGFLLPACRHCPRPGVLCLWSCRHDGRLCGGSMGTYCLSLLSCRSTTGWQSEWRLSGKDVSASGSILQTGRHCPRPVLLCLWIYVCTTAEYVGFQRAPTVLSGQPLRMSAAVFSAYLPYLLQRTVQDDNLPRTTAYLSRWLKCSGWAALSILSKFFLCLPQVMGECIAWSPLG